MSKTPEDFEKQFPLKEVYPTAPQGMLGAKIPTGLPSQLGGYSPPEFTRPSSEGLLGKRENILEEANRLTSQDRNKDYGHPLDNFQQTVDLINIALRKKLKEPLVAEDFGLIMILAKVSRETNRRTRDNKVDIAGYARTIDMIEQEREKRLDDLRKGLYQEKDHPFYKYQATDDPVVRKERAKETNQL
jgi:hypothetical protein